MKAKLEDRIKDTNLVITSDCHNASKLDGGFDMAEKLLKKCGFREKYILTEDGFTAVIIKMGVFSLNAPISI